MNNNTYTAKETSFWEFIQQNEIEIPIIQRDYAQGRLGKENLRKNFLGDLKKALDSEKPYDNKVMKLDFVYGSVERQKMNPLDGQQRLTTLWLLHWYIALRACKLKEVAEILNHFTYETRISSREFCSDLCNQEYFDVFDGNNIVGFITKQTWFYSAWKQDPTIQAMLRMLGGTKITDKKGKDITDGIEEFFIGVPKEKFEEYWTKLTSDGKSPIVFYHLPLENFGLTDDLYIKMNARGKQLTSFENFKADLVGYITEQSESELLDEGMKNKWKALLHETDGIPIKMDTTWTDIFWKNKSKGSKIDEIFFAFLNRFFWDELFMYKNNDGKYFLDIGKGDESSTQENRNESYKYLNNSEASQNVYDTTIAYKELDVYKFFNREIPYSVFEDLQKILNRNTVIPECAWDNSFKFIPEYEKDNNDNNIEITDTANNKILKITHLTQVQRIVFHAVCKYFIDGNADSDSLKQWMRVVYNLVSGIDQNGRPQIRSTQAMRTVIEFIDRLDSHNVYNSLYYYNEKNLSDSDFDERCKEEIEKARKILDEFGNLRKYDGKNYDTWEELISEAENYAFFNGAIRFLFRESDSYKDWSNFYAKWNNAKELIPSAKENRHTIKNILSYLADEDILEIFSIRNLSNDNNNLRSLLQKEYPKLHDFLMQQNQKQTNSLLQDDLLYLCEHYPNYWIHRSWKEGKNILSNYEKRTGYYEYESFVIGDNFFSERLQILNILSDNGTITVEKHNKVWKGLYIQFEYEKHVFRWQLNDWIDMYDNQMRNLWEEGLHSHYKGNEEYSFYNVESLINELNRCVKSFNLY